MQAAIRPTTSSAGAASGCASFGASAVASDRFKSLVRDCGREVRAAIQRLAQKHGVEACIVEVIVRAGIEGSELDPDAAMKAQLLMEESRA